MLKDINCITKRSLAEILPELDRGLVKSALEREIVYDYVMEYGRNEELKRMIGSFLLGNSSGGIKNGKCI